MDACRAIARVASEKVQDMEILAQRRHPAVSAPVSLPPPKPQIGAAAFGMRRPHSRSPVSMGTGSP